MPSYEWLDELLAKMERVLQENVLVIADLERKKYEAPTEVGAFSRSMETTSLMVTPR